MSLADSLTLFYIDFEEAQFKWLRDQKVVSPRELYRIGPRQGKSKIEPRPKPKCGKWLERESEKLLTKQATFHRVSF